MRISKKVLDENEIIQKKNQRIGKYRIVSVLGQGGDGIVYLAEDILLKKQWAIKQIKKDEYLKIHGTNVLEESLIMCKLDHPGIPRIIEQIEDERCFYIVMDFCKGESLWDFCKRNAASIDQILDWGIQLCDILSYLHEQNPPVIFCDVKPGNIIYGRDKRIKLIDFGIAKLGMYGYDAKGTKGFAAPEQYKGRYSIESDIYNLGATLLWCMKDRYCPSLKKILKKAIAKYPGKRYESCALLKKELINLQTKRRKKYGLKKAAFMLLGISISFGVTGIIAFEDAKMIENTRTIEERQDSETIIDDTYEKNLELYIEKMKNKREDLQKMLEQLQVDE